MTVYVRCRHCDGRGKREHNRASHALDCVGFDSWTSTTDVAEHMRIGPTNAANLLALLHDQGLVERSGSGSRHSPYMWRRPRAALEGKG